MDDFGTRTNTPDCIEDPVKHRRRRLRARAAAGLGALLGAAMMAGVPTAQAEHADPAEPRRSLHLVTLDGPGTAGYEGALPPALQVLSMRTRQDRLLRAVGAPEPTYRWTTALNGFAVHLTPGQAEQLRSDEAVALVERNEVRPLAGLAAPSAAPGIGQHTVRGPARGGEGTVIGVVDTGLAPESPLFAATVPLGKEPARFSGGCQPGDGWDEDDCDAKVVGARWFLAGFGEDNLRAAASVSPRDTDGHGTQVASIAAGNAGVPVRAPGQSLGRYGGMAPQARLAVYKACWSAPDPADDGCATADLVTAIDRATQDGVDVLNLAVSGPHGVDTVERALLGAAEADIVTVAAAGNDGDRVYAAHPTPWVTTVGGLVGAPRQGSVVAQGGPRLTGAMVSGDPVPPSRVVLGSRAGVRGATSADARVCAPGSLDAAEVDGAVVLCERGRVGRVDKSRAVALAGGVGMVLVNTGPGAVSEDFHSVPTVHLAAGPGSTLRRWVADHPDARIALRPSGRVAEPRSVAGWSSPGDPAGATLKPDVVAPAAGVLGAVPDGKGSTTWDFLTGSSAASGYVSGVAATLLSARGWDAATVRSALATSAAPLRRAPVLRSGAGRVRPEPAGRPGLLFEVDPAHYRQWLEGDRTQLNTPSIVLAGGQTTARRTITNPSKRALYFSSDAVGFRRGVTVRPAAVRLSPGESATFEIEVAPGSRADDGHVVWRGATGTVTSIPVQVSR